MIEVMTMWNAVILLSLACVVAAAHGNELVATAGEELKNKSPEVQVGVWYNTFFTRDDEFGHWKGVEERKQAMPLGGRYSVSDPQVMERQLAQMAACGIDFIVMDHTNTIWVDNSLVNRNILNWYDFMDSKPEAERIPLAIAAGGELNQHGNRESWTHAVDYLYKEYAGRPSYLRIEGKPVLHWYIEKDVWPDWTDQRWEIRKTYHFFLTARMVSEDGWGYGCDPKAIRPKNCFSMHPGWDLSPPGHPREGGMLYIRQWIEALKLRPKYVFIAMWNGWTEGDALEDSDSWKDTYGDPSPSWYRRLTQGYVAAIKGNLIDGFYYKDEDDAAIYRWKNGNWVKQRAHPRKTPIIILPKGMREPLSKSDE